LDSVGLNSETLKGKVDEVLTGVEANAGEFMVPLAESKEDIDGGLSGVIDEID
jgi:hypothetical protein